MSRAAPCPSREWSCCLDDAHFNLACFLARRDAGEARKRYSAEPGLRCECGAHPDGIHAGLAAALQVFSISASARFCQASSVSRSSVGSRSIRGYHFILDFMP